MSHPRIFYLDALKGLLILLVVMGHCMQGAYADCFHQHAWNYIYSFHMGAFMLVSGFVSYKAVLPMNSLTKRAKELLIPFGCWSLVNLLIQQYKFTPPQFLNSVNIAVLHPDTSFWFVWVLFWIIMLVYLCDKLAIRLHARQEIFTLSTAILLIGLMVVGEVRVFGFQFIAYYYLSFLFGFYMRKYQDWLITDSKKRITVVGLVWTIGAYFWNMHDLPSFLAPLPLPHALMQYAYRTVVSLIGAYFWFHFAKLLFDKQSILTNVLSYFGRISLGMYIIHLVWLGHILNLLQPYITDVYGLIIVSFIIVTPLSVITIKILSLFRWSRVCLLGQSA